MKQHFYSITIIKLISFSKNALLIDNKPVKYIQKRVLKCKNTGPSSRAVLSLHVNSLTYIDECFFSAVGILVLNIVVSIVCQISKTSFRSLTKAPLVDDLLFKKGNVCKLTPYIYRQVGKSEYTAS